MGRDKDPRTMMWEGPVSTDPVEIQREKDRQQRLDPFKCIYFDRWNEEGFALSALAKPLKGKHAACDACSRQSKSCSGQMPACPRCVRRGKGATCTYTAWRSPTGFDVGLARRRVQKRHERIYIHCEISYEQSQKLPISNVGTAGSAPCHTIQVVGIRSSDAS
jgi:hypothetical protein